MPPGSSMCQDSLKIHYEKLMKYLREIYDLYTSIYSCLVFFIYQKVY